MKGFALVDCARSGVENMALDQRMLEVAGDKKCVLVRVYQWAEPTVSLGYFQRFDDRLMHSASIDLPTVRRSTGGGAIIHHHDWTYCVAMPDNLAVGTSQASAPASRLGASVPLYDCIHDEVVTWLNQLGFPAVKWNSACKLSPQQTIPKSQHPFLCFERRNCGDVVVQQHKVMGSAQRRGAGAVLQHGSLLLASSPHAPGLSGLWGCKSQATVADAQPLNNPEFFLHRVVSALQSSTTADLIFIPSCDELPFPWHWPFESKYADRNWTCRL